MAYLLLTCDWYIPVHSYAALLCSVHRWIPPVQCIALPTPFCWYYQIWCNLL